MIDNVSLDDDLTHYFDSFADSVNPTHKKNEIEEIDSLLIENNEKNNTKTEKLEDAKTVLDEFIRYSMSPVSKYKTIRELIFAINGFCNGNVRNITRDFNFRQRFISTLDKDRINAITNNDLITYIKKLSNQNDTKYNDFIGACQATLTKYGREQLRAAINKALKGNYGAFTNSMGNYRNKIERLTKEELMECIEELLDTNALYFDRDIGVQCVEKLEETLMISSRTTVLK